MRKQLTRPDLVQIVNRWILLRAFSRPSPAILLRQRAWQRAAFIARQNRLLPETIIRALTKHGTTDVIDPALEDAARLEMAA